MLDIQYQCSNQTLVQRCTRLQLASVSRANVREKKSDASVLSLVLKRESQKNWPNRPESYMNNITVNPTQKGTEMFIALIRKTCPGLYENLLNSY